MQTKSLAVVEIIEINQPQPAQPPVEPVDPRKPFLCRHIFVDGRRCGSPSLRDEHFCYYHQTHRTPALVYPIRKRPVDGFDLTRLDGLDNHAAIQLALSEVIGGIAENSIDPKRAGLLIYGLQVAGNNLRHSRPKVEKVPDVIVEDGTYGQLAELEPNRTVPPSVLDRMTTALERCNVDPPTKSLKTSGS